MLHFTIDMPSRKCTSSSRTCSVDSPFFQPPDVKAEIERQLREGSWIKDTQSDAQHVREFTAGAGQPTPERPCLMTEDEVKFLGKMMLDEIMELFATVLPAVEAKDALKGFIDSRHVSDCWLSRDQSSK
jgi:hypothetical protein